MDLEKFGEFIKSLRKEKGLNQEQLADELHVHRTTIVKWEQGRSLPLNDTLVLLGKYFDVTVDELLAGERITKDTPIEEKSKVVLSLLNYHRKSVRTIIHISIVLFIVTVSFLIYYFFNTYNSIHVYLLHGEGETYKTRDSLMIVSNDKVYLRIGNISELNDNKNLNINKISLYIDYGDKTKELFVGDPNELLVQNRKSIEIFSTYHLKKEYNNFYLVIDYNDQEEIIKLDVIRDFENKSLLSIITRDTNETYKEDNNSINLSNEFVYNEDEDSYKLVKDNFEIICGSDKLSCTIYGFTDDYIHKYKYYYDYNLLEYVKISNGVIVENKKIDLKNIDNTTKECTYFKENFLDKYLS